jgi:ribosomal protein L20A (L18A)
MHKLYGQSLNNEDEKTQQYILVGHLTNRMLKEHRTHKEHRQNDQDNVYDPEVRNLGIKHVKRHSIKIDSVEIFIAG